MITFKCRVVSDKATRMPYYIQLISIFVLMVTSAENADSQTYIAANGIKASTARSARRECAYLEEH